MTTSSIELHKELFEDTLKTQAWAKVDGNKFLAMLGHDKIRLFNTEKDALEYAKAVQMRCLKDHAAWIVGEGNKYRGLVAEFLPRGN